MQAQQPLLDATVGSNSGKSVSSPRPIFDVFFFFPPPPPLPAAFWSLPLLLLGFGGAPRPIRPKIWSATSVSVA